MAFVHGKAATFSVDDSGGTPRNISTYLSNINFNPTADTAEVSSFGDTNKKYIPGLKDGQITADVNWDATVDGYLYGILGGAEGDFDYSPDGTIHYTGKCICTAYNPASAVNDAIKGSVTFQITGPVGRA